MSKLIFFIQEAFRAMRRNGAPTLAAIVTTVVTVILLGVLIPVLQSTQAKSEDIRDSLEFRVAVFDDATAAEKDALQRKIEAVPHVDSVTLITKREALEELKAGLDPEERETLLAQLHSNPLPANFKVYADDAGNLKSIKEAIPPPPSEGKPSSFSPVVADVFDRTNTVEQIVEVTGALKIVLSVLTLLLILASLLLIGNTIRLSIYTRRREVEVMRLVGATRWFIRWPFMIEGMVVGFVGSVLAILTLWIGKVTIADPLSDKFEFLAAQDNLAFPMLIAILFAAAVLVSAVGSGVTLRRFLKV